MINLISIIFMSLFIKFYNHNNDKTRKNLNFLYENLFFEIGNEN